MWIAGITRGHNAGVCLLKDGKIVFNSEEERYSRYKYDGGPFASMTKILEYTDKIDYLAVAHTTTLQDSAIKVDFAGDDVYTAMARKLRLIEKSENLDPSAPHPQVIDLSEQHHKLHASIAFYNSGFDSAVAVIVDGAGTFLNLNHDSNSMTAFELESIFSCEYPAKFKTLYRHIGTNGPLQNAYMPDMDSSSIKGEYGTHECIIDDTCGIVKTYEAVTHYCRFACIEAGKTMGLFPYGKPNPNIPKLFTNGGPGGLWESADRNVLIPTYPNGGRVNENRFSELNTHGEYKNPDADVTVLQNRRDMAYAVQTETQEQVLKLILKAVEMTGNKNVVLAGGYGLNCVANYYYLEELNKHGIKLYVEPMSNDAGTAMGAAYAVHYMKTRDTRVREPLKSLYLGMKYCHSNEEIESVTKKYNGEIQDISNEEVVNLITGKTTGEKSIVAVFQGGAEAGPRALGNRSILYDPTDPNGKDHVNKIKRREYFRPFAGTILKEHVHDWFDLRGMDDSPFMMYAVNCQPGVEEKIPSIIHVDGTCRIQTVTREENENYYNLIEEFYNQTGVPIIFNTSFNLGGEPLVETLDDAVRTLADSGIEYLYLPEYGKLITVKN